MGMRVGVGRLAMGSPAGMANAAASRQRVRGQPLGDDCQAAGCLNGLKALFSEYGNASGVIAAVFQCAKSLQQDLNGVFRTGVTYNTTHIEFSLSM